MRALLLIVLVAVTFATLLWLRQRPAPTTDPHQASLERIEVARARGQIDAAAATRLHVEAAREREAGQGPGDAAGGPEAHVGH